MSDRIAGAFWGATIMANSLALIHDRVHWIHVVAVVGSVSALGRVPRFLYGNKGV